MRRHRFIIPDAKLSGPDFTLKGDYAQQIRTVLRAKLGDEIIICDGLGSEAIGTIREMKDGVIVSLGEAYIPEIESAREVTIYAAITKRDTFEWACQKATECGAFRIVPITTERTVKQNINLERIRTIMREAAEQSGRAVVPEITEITSFNDVLSAEHSLRYIASTLGGTPLGSVDLSGVDNVGILIGPEGGFTDGEEERALDAGWTPISLGARILRAETAVAIASYLAAQ